MPIRGVKRREPAIDAGRLALHLEPAYGLKNLAPLAGAVTVSGSVPLAINARGQAWQVSSGNNFQVAGVQTALLQEITIVVTVEITTGTDYGMVISGNNGGTDIAELRQSALTGRLEWTVLRPSASYMSLQTPSSIVGTGPRSIVARYTRTDGHLWMDGALVTTTTHSAGAMSWGTHTWGIGARGVSGSTTYPLTGRIGRVRIIGAALSLERCAALSADPVWKERRIWVPVSTGGAYTLTAEQGSYTLTGQAAGLLAGRVLAAAQGSYTLTGQDVALLKGNTLTADQGSYALTGQDVALLRGLLLSAAQGSYALTGQDATLTYTPLGAFSLTADQGNYTLTGQSASLLWGPVLAAGQGSYTLNGQDATLTYTPVGAYILTAGQGSYALTGQDVLLQCGHVLAAAQGSYSLTGQAATLARGLVLAAAQGSYALNGQAAAFRRTYVLSAGYGSYALTGQIVSLTYSGAALEALEYLLLISHITQSMSKTSKVTMEVDRISRIQQQLDGSSSI